MKKRKNLALSVEKVLSDFFEGKQMYKGFVPSELKTPLKLTFFLGGSEIRLRILVVCDT